MIIAVLSADIRVFYIYYLFGCNKTNAKLKVKLLLCH